MPATLLQYLQTPIQYQGTFNKLVFQSEEEENGSHVFVIRVNLMFINEINDNK